MWIKRNPWVIQKLYLNCTLPTFLTIVFSRIYNIYLFPIYLHLPVRSNGSL